MTKQKELFCTKLIENKFNATQAAKDAGYSPKSAKSKASQLLMEKEVQVYLSSLQAEIKENYDINVSELINEFKAIKNTDITDIFDIVDNQIVLKKGIKKLSSLPKSITLSIKSLKNTPNGIAIEMYPRDNALINLAKIAGLFIEKIEHSGGVEVVGFEIVQPNGSENLHLHP